MRAGVRNAQWLAEGREFRAHAGEHLSVEPVGADAAARMRGDHDLNPDALDMQGEEVALCPAAVLVPVVPRAKGLNVILTRRTAHLSSHAGQIAFPGGKMDEEDSSPFATALREAEEEIGLTRAAVELVGYLDHYRTGTGFLITPCVSLVASDASFQADPQEVDQIFEVPLAFLMDAANHRRHSGVWRGARRYYFAMPYGEHYIWGATAGILRNLHERLVHS